MTDNKLNMIPMNLLLVAALLLANAGPVNGQQNNSTTSVGQLLPGIQCGKVGDINTAFIQIQRNDESGGTYTVRYTFDWGPTAYTTFIELSYGVETTVNSTNAYKNLGVYNTGYTVEFCREDGKCADNGGDTFSSTALLKIDDGSCDWGYTTPSPSATVELASAPTYALSPTIVSSSSGLYSLFPALTMSGILTMILSRIMQIKIECRILAR
jgi:hypothetical protein